MRMHHKMLHRALQREEARPVVLVKHSTQEVITLVSTRSRAT